MLVFDEKKYAKEIIEKKEYHTVKNQGRENCILVRYLKDIGYSNDKIISFLLKINAANHQFLSIDEKKIIFSKILKKAIKYPLIKNIEVKLYKEELDIITKIEDKYIKRILFVLLVYYKWASQLEHLRFFSKNNNAYMVVEDNNSLWKIAGVNKLRVYDRYKIFNYLFQNFLYKIDNFKNYNYIYKKKKKSEGDEVIVINNYDNILGELEMYENPEKYKRCAVCGVVITKTRSPKKYCKECARKENIRKTKENKKSLKTKSL